MVSFDTHIEHAKFIQSLYDRIQQAVQETSLRLLTGHHDPKSKFYGLRRLQLNSIIIFWKGEINGQSLTVDFYQASRVQLALAKIEGNEIHCCVHPETTIKLIVSVDDGEILREILFPVLTYQYIQEMRGQ